MAYARSTSMKPIKLINNGITSICRLNTLCIFDIYKISKVGIFKQILPEIPGSAEMSAILKNFLFALISSAGIL